VAKLSSALASNNYLLCMQNAALIRYHGEYLRLSNHMLEASGLNKWFVLKVSKVVVLDLEELCY